MEALASPNLTFWAAVFFYLVTPFSYQFVQS